MTNTLPRAIQITGPKTSIERPSNVLTKSIQSKARFYACVSLCKQWGNSDKWEAAEWESISL